jgi:hypothetical protein
MNLSCTPPQQFQAFSQHRAYFTQPSLATAGAAPELDGLPSASWRQADAVLDPQIGLSSKKLTSLFVSGFALGFSGRYLLRSFLQKQKVPAPHTPKATPGPTPPPGEASDALSSAPTGLQKVNIWYQFQEKLYSMFALAVREPSQIPTLMSYTATCVLGYLSGTVLQGTQEAWVRREETLIRSQLLSRMTGLVRGSIQVKNNLDQSLHDETALRIQSLLRQAGIDPQKALSPSPMVTEPLQQNQRYFYEPTHRTLHPGVSQQFSGDPSGNWEIPSRHPAGQASIAGLKPLEWGALGVGLVMGNMFHGLAGLMRSVAEETAEATARAESARKNFTTEMVEYINVSDLEGFFVKGMNKNIRILAGLLALTATARIGKLWVDGLREIEVTRMNAYTEYKYQHYTWLTLDPKFHDIAEREAIDSALKRLEADLPRLKADPARLEQQIQAMLTNIGRNSAPKYYPMIPLVGLREARS